MVTATILTHDWSSGVLALALAVMCWPAGPGRLRLVAVLPLTGVGVAVRWWVRALGVLLNTSESAGPTKYVVPVLLAAPLGAWLGGPGAAVAAALAAGLGYQRWRSARRRRRQAGELAGLLEAVGVLSAELRAGAHPATAAAVAAESMRGAVGADRRRRVRRGAGSGAVGRVLGSVAAGAKLGAEIPTLLLRHAEGEPVIGAELSRLAAAWTLADRHGITLADLLDAVRADLESRSRLAGQIGAQLVGPKSTAAVLAGLPVLGILLGQGIGADPWRVLTGTPAGQLLLVLGTALTCAGAMWSGRITGNVVPR
jgi:tight adherence protein B